jgi:hypothetical protein
MEKQSLKNLYGPEIAFRAQKALSGLPPPDDNEEGCYATIKRLSDLKPLYRFRHIYHSIEDKAVSIISEQGIEGFEKLCSSAIELIEKESYWDKVEVMTFRAGSFRITERDLRVYLPKSVKAAEKYLKDNGIG